MIELMFRTRLAILSVVSRRSVVVRPPATAALTHDTGWFWDTELLLLAASGGWRVRFVPVRWVEDTDSRVKVGSTAWRDIKGLARMRKFDWSKARKPGA